MKDPTYNFGLEEKMGADATDQNRESEKKLYFDKKTQTFNTPDGKKHECKFFGIDDYAVVEINHELNRIELNGKPLYEISYHNGTMSVTMLDSATFRYTMSDGAIFFANQATMKWSHDFARHDVQLKEITGWREFAHSVCKIWYNTISGEILMDPSSEMRYFVKSNLLKPVKARPDCALIHKGASQAKIFFAIEDHVGFALLVNKNGTEPTIMSVPPYTTTTKVQDNTTTFYLSSENEKNIQSTGTEGRILLFHPETHCFELSGSLPASFSTTFSESFEIEPAQTPNREPALELLVNNVPVFTITASEGTIKVVEHQKEKYVYRKYHNNAMKDRSMHIDFLSLEDEKKEEQLILRALQENMMGRMFAYNSPADSIEGSSANGSLGYSVAAYGILRRADAPSVFATDPEERMLSGFKEEQEKIYFNIRDKTQKEMIESGELMPGTVLFKNGFADEKLCEFGYVGFAQTPYMGRTARGQNICALIPETIGRALYRCIERNPEFRKKVVIEVGRVNFRRDYDNNEWYCRPVFGEGVILVGPDDSYWSDFTDLKNYKRGAKRREDLCKDVADRTR